MSHESVIAGLKALTSASLLDRDTDAHVEYIEGESDRAMIILESAVLEDALLARLQERMSGLNSDESNRVFHYSGPAGSFSSRLWLAQGLGILDRTTRRRFEVVKDMRNAAAHSHDEITFGTERVREATIYLLPLDARNEVPDSASQYEMRCVFQYTLAIFQMRLAGPSNRELNAASIKRVMAKARKRDASLDK